MASLIRSRKFWLAILDVLISTATFFLTKYGAPALAEDVLWVIAAWQPVIVALITGIAIEDAALKKSGNFFAGSNE